MAMTDSDVAQVVVRRRRAPSVVGVVVGALVVACVAAWLLVGLSPRIGGGSMFGTDPEAVAPEPEGLYGPDEQIVTDPSDGSLDGEWTFANRGPVTIVVRAASQEGVARYDIQLRLMPQNGGSSIADADVVTVGPGEQFAVAYSFAPGCMRMSPRTGFGTDSVRLRVSTLGLSRTVDVHTDQPLVYRTEIGRVPPAGCES